MPQAAVLKPGQYRHLLRVTRATSRDPERDVLVLLLGIHTGMRVSEIAQIEVRDVLFPSGAIRPEVSLRAAITKGLRQRCIYPATGACAMLLTVRLFIFWSSSQKQGWPNSLANVCFGSVSACRNSQCFFKPGNLLS